MMTKTILVMRHAKSSWDDRELKDFDRPLNKRGKKDTPKMGRHLNKKKLKPGRIICSPAARAKATIMGVLTELDVNEDILTWNEDLYYGDSRAYLDAVRSADNLTDVVMTVGHNPMTEYLIAQLSDRPFHEKVPTAAIACFTADVSSWGEIKPGMCRLDWFVKPKSL